MKIEILILIILMRTLYAQNQTEDKEGYFASCSDDMKIILWNKMADHIVLGQHNDSVKSIELLSTDILISGSLDGFIKVWNLTSFNLIYSFNIGNGIIKILKLNESNFLIASMNSSLYHFMLNEYAALESCYTNHSEQITGLEVFDSHIVTSSLDGSLKFWNMSLNEIKTISINSSIYSLEVVDGSEIFCGSNDGLIFIYNFNLQKIDETIHVDTENGTILSILYLKSEPNEIIGTTTSKLIFRKNLNNLETRRNFNGESIWSLEKISNSFIACGLSNGSIITLNSKGKSPTFINLNQHSKIVNSIKSISYENAQNFPVYANSSNSVNTTTTLSIEEMAIEEVLYFLSSSADLTDCLGNCSNQGTCKKNDLKYYCSCAAYYGGSTCQLNLKPCSSNPCLNSGLCLEDLEKSTYQCNCTRLFEGNNCQTKVDVCSNETCSSHGYCVDESDLPKCECFYQYSGEKCEIESSEKKFQKFVVTTSTIIAILFLISFFLLLLIIDLSELCCRKSIKKKPRKNGLKFF